MLLYSFQRLVFLYCGNLTNANIIAFIESAILAAYWSQNEQNTRHKMIDTLLMTLYDGVWIIFAWKTLMYNLRLRKSGIIACILLPYLLLAACSGFMHHHEGEIDSYLACIHASTQVHLHSRISAHPSTSHHSQECLACSWAASSVSCPLVVFFFTPVYSISIPIYMRIDSYHTWNSAPVSSRAPPLGWSLHNSR